MKEGAKRMKLEAAEQHELAVAAQAQAQGAEAAARGALEAARASTRRREGAQAAPRYRDAHALFRDGKYEAGPIFSFEQTKTTTKTKMPRFMNFKAQVTACISISFPGAAASAVVHRARARARARGRAGGNQGVTKSYCRGIINSNHPSRLRKSLCLAGYFF